ncbi:MAG: ATP-binding protein [Bythopirellula sp.]|nr:ATP-binding protein [Bythopirellula sp.]
MEDCSRIDTLERPFVTAPDPDRYFPAVVIEEARRRLTRCIERGEGPALLIGGTGTGKSLLLEVLARQYRNKMTTVLLAGAQLCTRRALQQSILFQLGLPYRQLEEGDLRLSLLEFLRPLEGKPRKLLLLVDEADSMPTRLLEELRALTNISYKGELLVGLVLVGCAALEERFAEPELEVFSQRLAHRCYLSPFSREETFQYLRAQVAAVGIDPAKLYAQDGLEAIFTATDGVPRLINQIGDQLVWLVGETGYAPIDAAIVQQAWSDLQQIPAPWNLTATEELNNPVEFGELSLGASVANVPVIEEAEDEMPASIPINGRLYGTYGGGGAYGEGDEFFDSLNSTDVIVEQFQNLDTTARAYTAPLARNPFAEDFASEEVVFDRYLEFEDQMLAHAPRVINRLDTAFAQQLKMCEIAAAPVAEKTVAPEPANRLERMAIKIEPAVIAQVAEETEESAEIHPAGFGDILIVEDERPMSATIVSSRNFRQLFSNLEMGSKPHRVG